MTISDFDREWEKLAEEVLSGLKEWRIQHPRATLKEIEEALDQRLNRMRARMLRIWRWQVRRQVCRRRGHALVVRSVGSPWCRGGKGNGGCRPTEGKRLFWNRVMAYVPGVGWGFFPLDEELQLLSGGLTPRLEEELSHLGAWMPFEKAWEMMRRMRGVEVSEATVRRHTEGNGAVYVAVQEAEVERIEKALPEAPAGPERQLLSVDGAMVPLAGGE